MAQKRYRVIAKVACGECLIAISTRKKLNTNCQNCDFKKWNNVTNLLKFTSFLNVEHSNWIWFNVYEYKKGEPGIKLGSFQRGKNEPHSITLT